MSIGELLRWRWDGYPRYHQACANLFIHIVAVPFFLLGTIGLVAAAFERSPVVLTTAIGYIVAAMASQGRGHRLERVPPERFSGSLNSSLAFLIAQWVTYRGLFSHGAGVWLCARSRAVGEIDNTVE